MPGDRYDADAEASAGGSPALRTAGLAAGAVLAGAATAVVFLTEDPRLLRLAVVAGAWAFVVAALAASRRVPRPGDGGAAALRSVERRLAEESAARREADGRLVDDVRREVAQVADLRAGLARVDELRRDLAAVDDLRRELRTLEEVRREVAGLAELRAGLAGVAELRADLAELSELRADIGRLRGELTSGGMLVERVRTESVRIGPATVESPAVRTVDPGWSGPTVARPAVLAGEPVVTATVEEVRPARVDDAVPVPRPPVAPPPSAEPRRRRTDGTSAAPHDALPTVQRPVPQHDRPPVPHAGPATAGTGPLRVEQLLSGNGSGPATGGRRRRRYREDGEPDDVLARVLRR